VSSHISLTSLPGRKFPPGVAVGAGMSTVWKVTRWAAIAVVIASFLWQVCHGECPVP
jgi:hypothetical protein